MFSLQGILKQKYVKYYGERYITIRTFAFSLVVWRTHTIKENLNDNVLQSFI